MKNNSILRVTIVALVALFLVWATEAQTVQNNAQNMKVKTINSINLSYAQEIILEGVRSAKEQGINLSFAVVDQAGNLIAFTRMDEAAIVSIDVAIGKAKTAAYLKAPSKVFEEMVNSGVTSINTVPNILPLQGGVPLQYNGEIIGAIGVSGAKGDQDNAMAEYLAQLVN